MGFLQCCPRRGTVAVGEFIVTDDEVDQLLALLRKENVRVFYARIPAVFGVINPKQGDPTNGGVLPKEGSP